MIPIRARAAGARTLALVVCSCALASGGGALAREGDWYVGAGGSAAFLRPDAVVAGFEVEEGPVAGGTLYLGRDLDARSSVQLQLHGLGESEFESGETVGYLGADAAVLYRFLDTRDGARRLGPVAGPGAAFGLSLHGRFGLGLLERDAEIELENAARVHFGVGAGAELHVTRTLALRAEAVYHDTDAASLSLGLVARFGQGSRGVPPPAPPPSDRAAPAATPDGGTPRGLDPESLGSVELVEPPVGPGERTPAPPDGTDASSGTDTPSADPAAADATAEPDAELAEPASSPAEDADGDGVPDAADVCPASARGFPVRGNGCALLDGVLSGVRFAAGTAELLPGATEQLDYLANLLAEHPEARIELRAHTDDAGGVREQSVLTRARLRTVGLYLVQQRGVRANRITLRSFGGTRPLYDNDTPENRERNNRVEVAEDTD